MGFLSGWFLLGAAAIGLPVWLHLLRRHRSTPLPFSSLMFFERRTQSSVKHRRLHYLLLFSLRVALFLLLALAFAQPYIRRNVPLPGAAGKLAVIAVDQSFSMGEGDRLERARSAAQETLQRLGNADRAQIVSFANQVRFLTEPTNDRASLRSALASIAPTDSFSSYAELIRALRVAAGSSRLPLEIHLFSDMQQSSLPAGFADLQLPANASLVLHPAADSETANWTVESVSAPQRVYDAKPQPVRATIAVFQGEPASRRASLILNGRTVQTKTVEVGPSGRATVEFSPAEIPHGLNRGEVAIDSADKFAADDRYFFSVERGDARPVLFVRDSRDRRSELYFRSALEAAPDSPFRLEPITAERASAADLAKYAFVVLSDSGPLPARFAEMLGKYVRGGGAALIAVGRQTVAAGKVPLLESSRVESRYAPRDGARFQTPSNADIGHPSVAKADRWEGVKFYQAFRIEAEGPAIVRLGDGTPVLVEQRVGRGRVLVFGSTFDNVANDFPLQPSFVPFVEESAKHLSQSQDGPSSFPVDSHLELRAEGENADVSAVEVIGPDGGRALSLGEAASARSLQLDRKGFYEVRRGGGRQQLIAVNADRRESDLARATDETLALWRNTGSGTTAQGGSGGVESKPQSLWWYVLWAALALGIAEALVGNRHLAVARDSETAMRKGAAA